MLYSPVQQLREAARSDCEAIKEIVKRRERDRKDERLKEEWNRTAGRSMVYDVLQAT